MAELIAGLPAAVHWGLLIVLPAAAGFLVAKLIPSSAATPNTGYKVLGGAGAGLIVGAAVGSVVPVVGTVAGAVIGAIAGGIAGFFA